MKVIDLLDKMLSGNIMIKSDNDVLYCGELNNAPYSVMRREIMHVTIDMTSVSIVMKV